MSICRSMRLTCLSILLSVLGCGGDRTNELIAQLQDGDVGDRRAAVEALAICEGEQVTAAFESAISRPPTSEEVATLTRYADEHGMANTCRLIMNTNEFIFID